MLRAISTVQTLYTLCTESLVMVSFAFRHLLRWKWEEEGRRGKSENAKEATVYRRARYATV